MLQLEYDYCTTPGTAVWNSHILYAICHLHQDDGNVDLLRAARLDKEQRTGKLFEHVFLVGIFCSCGREVDYKQDAFFVEAVLFRCLLSLPLHLGQSSLVPNSALHTEAITLNPSTQRAACVFLHRTSDKSSYALRLQALRILYPPTPATTHYA